MNTNKPAKAPESGSSLVLVVVAIILLLVMGVGLLSLGMNSRIFAIRNAAGVVARSAADAGLTKAVFEMNEKLKVKPWSDVSLPQALNVTMASCDANFGYTVTGNVSAGFAVNSTGQSGYAQRAVASDLELKGPFEYAIFMDESIELKNGTVVDWYNFGADDENLKVGTNSIAAGAVDTKAGVTIKGDVAVGVGGDPDVVIDSKKEASITGETYALSEEYELLPVTVPDYLQALPFAGAIVNSTTLSSATKLNGINVGNSEIITIDKPVTLYVIGDIILGNSAELRIVDANINPDASLTLYLQGNLETKNGGTINNLAKDPQKLKIYGLSGCQSIDLKTAGTFYGAIYAPEADVHLHNSIDMFGAVVANSFIQDVFADFHYDASLRKVGINDVAIRFVVKHWSDK